MAFTSTTLIKNIPKSTKVLSIIALVLAFWAFLALMKGGKTNTLAAEDSQFSISDSGIVTKIVIKTKVEKELNFSFQLDKWEIDESKVDNEKMASLLAFVYRAQVKRPVFKEQTQIAIEKLKNQGLKLVYSQGEKPLKSFYVGYLGGPEDEVMALMDGYQTPYVVYIPGFSGSLAKLLKPEVEAWQTRVVFDSKINSIENLKVSFNFYPENGFEIVKLGTKYQVKEVAKADSLRLYSYLQLYESVDIKEWLGESKNRLKDSLLLQKPAFEIKLKDRNPIKSNQIKIFYNEGQKGNIYGLVGESNKLCIIRTSIFEYLLQKRSFFEGKK